MREVSWAIWAPFAKGKWTSIRGESAMKRTLVGIAVVCVVVVAGMRVHAHCQVPCGIYGDDRRFAQLEEDVATIEKAMRQIRGLSVEPDKNMHQLVRWVNTKEAHASHIIEVMATYFLAQRIKKPVAAKAASMESTRVRTEAYAAKLVACHDLIVGAMRCKQVTDLTAAAHLRASIEAFRTLYFAKADHKHLDKEHRGPAKAGK